MTEQVRGLTLRWLPWLLAAALVIAAIPVGLARGAPAVVLLAAFGVRRAVAGRRGAAGLPPA